MMNKRLSTPLADSFSGRLSRRSSLRIKDLLTVFPKNNPFSKISQMSPEKIARSSSTKLNNRLTKKHIYSPFDEETKIQKSMQRVSKVPQMRMSESKTSKKPMGRVKAYATNLYASSNSSNETRISIVSSMKKPGSKDQDICFYAIYDGHDGNQCSIFLRDNLHIYVCKQKSFPNDIATALKQGIKAIEDQFCKISRKTLCEAGSSLIVVITRDTNLYIANLGNSRAIMSSKFGYQISKLTTDHTPHNENQFNRVMKHGGMISKQRVNGTITNYYVMPGYKKTTRSIGDYLYKMRNCHIILSQPQIIEMKIDSNLDFILLGTDRLFGVEPIKQIVRSIWTNAINDKTDNIHEKAGNLIKMLLACSAKNVESTSGILLLFEGFQSTFFSQQLPNLPFCE